MSKEITANEISSLITSLEVRRESLIKQIIRYDNDIEQLYQILESMVKEPLEECDSLL